MGRFKQLEAAALGSQHESGSGVEEHHSLPLAPCCVNCVCSVSIVAARGIQIVGTE